MFGKRGTIFQVQRRSKEEILKAISRQAGRELAAGEFENILGSVLAAAANE